MEEIITATKARELCDDSSIILNRIFKFIKDRAKEGFTNLTYIGIGDLSNIAFNRILTKLLNLGYKVEMGEDTENPSSIEIKW